MHGTGYMLWHSCPDIAGTLPGPEESQNPLHLYNFLVEEVFCNPAEIFHP